MPLRAQRVQRMLGVPSDLGPAVCCRSGKSAFLAGPRPQAPWKISVVSRLCAAARGYRLILVMPESMSVERRKILALLGAELELTPAAGGMPAAIDRAGALLKTLPGAVQPSQFENPANQLVHALTTAEEIWAAKEGHFAAVVIGVGPSGYLKDSEW